MQGIKTNRYKLNSKAFFNFRPERLKNILYFRVEENEKNLKKEKKKKFYLKAEV